MYKLALSMSHRSASCRDFWDLIMDDRATKNVDVNFMLALEQQQSRYCFCLLL